MHTTIMIIFVIKETSNNNNNKDITKSTANTLNTISYYFSIVETNYIFIEKPIKKLFSKTDTCPSLRISKCLDPENGPLMTDDNIQNTVAMAAQLQAHRLESGDKSNVR